MTPIKKKSQYQISQKEFDDILINWIAIVLAVDQEDEHETDLEKIPISKFLTAIYHVVDFRRPLC